MLPVLMVTAFVDMLGLLMVLPLLPYYATRLKGEGLVVSFLGQFGLAGDGFIVAVLVSSFAIAQLLSAPLWGRVSDRYGRRPALLIGLGASAIAYVVFALADSVDLLLVSRLVQGAGGGTVGVIQAYVADATAPENRARALGWLSAATNAGVAIGPAIGSFTRGLGDEAPGLVAAMIVLVNMMFAWLYLRESHDVSARPAKGVKIERSRDAVWRVITRWSQPAPRLIWMYAIAMGAFQGLTAILALFLAMRHGVDEQEIGYFFVYIGVISVVTRALVLGPVVDRLGEARLSRVGALLLALGLATMPLTYSLVPLALSVALIPLGTAFTFPCITSTLSRVIPTHDRGLYMGVQQTFGGAARVLGPIWAGWAYDRLSVGVPFWTAAALVLATILLGLDMEKYTGPPGAEVAAVAK